MPYNKIIAIGQQKASLSLGCKIPLKLKPYKIYDFLGTFLPFV
jgi:hypothetical protein